MSKVDELLKRLPREEGERRIPYDDKTGKSVRAPIGKLTWGHGYFLEEIGEPGLYAVIDRYLASKHDQYLSRFPWYAALDDVRGSVPLDVAYNAGDTGELLGFPHFIAALERGDIATAASELQVKDPELDKSRYAPLRQILLTGQNQP